MKEFQNEAQRYNAQAQHPYPVPEHGVPVAVSHPRVVEGLQSGVRNMSMMEGNGYLQPSYPQDRLPPGHRPKVRPCCATGSSIHIKAS